MRAFQLILIILLTASLRALAGDASTNAEAGVFIQAFRSGRPITGVERLNFSSDRFFEKWGEAPEFSGQVIRRWRTNYAVFSKALVTAAEKEHLDTSSLAKILQIIRTAPENKGLAILPVAVHSTKQDGQPVWVVALQWEGAAWAAHTGRLGHIRRFTVTQKTLKQVDFSTCG